MAADKTIKVIDKILEWAVYSILFAIPFSKSIVEIAVTAGIILLVAKKVILRDYRLPMTPANIPLLFVFLTAVLSLYNSQFIGLSLRALFTKNLKFIALYFFVIEVINDETKIKNTLKVGMLSAGMVFLDSFIQYFITHIDLLHNYPAFKYFNQYNYLSLEEAVEVKRFDRFHEYFIGYPTGPFPFPNDLSAWLLIILPVMLFLPIFDLVKNRSKYFILASSFIGLYLFVLAKARGAWMGLIISLASLFFLIKNKAAVFTILLLMFALILLCFATGAGVVFGLSSMKDRNEMWDVSFAIFKEHPVIGNGINTFFNKYKELRTDGWEGLKGSYAHNCYLQWAADTGILGLVSFLWFCVSVVGSAWAFIRKTKDEFYRALATGLAVGITAFLIHSFVDTNLYSLNLASLFWLSTGFLTAVIRKKEESSP
ncbi:MAG: O-antigen ligase family protein [Candidatus Omnitrophota bacterium]|nr:O-antigen ligase family protein [Candidatus Omnitrophota bacterium]